MREGGGSGERGIGVRWSVEEGRTKLDYRVDIHKNLILIK